MKAELKSVEEYLRQWADSAIQFLPNLLGAFALIVVGFWLVRIVDKLLHRFFENRDYEVSLETFLRSFIGIGLKIVIIITAAGIVGFPTTSLVAIFGAAGLAVGLALQGSLSNFAGGVLILIFRPFKVGDLVTLSGEFGEIKEIQIFNTIILTPDNRTVIFPNGAISNGTIINHSKHGNLLVEMKLSIDFTEDFENVRSIILKELNNDPNVLKNPAADVFIIGYGDTSLQLTIRPYAEPKHYWDVHFNTLNNLRRALIANGVRDPQPVTRVMVMKND
jgi:small conductance mechanosensitive channel